MSTIALAPTRQPFPLTLPGLRFEPVAPDLWRVSRASGAVLGHVERRRFSDHERYAARFSAPGSATPRALGEFWSVRDAAECFR